MVARRAAPTVLAVLAAALYLLARLAPDVEGKPLFLDEAVAGLVSAQPLDEVLRAVLVDRGGAPAHFVLAHFALTLDASAATLRWLSVAFALATVPLAYDLGRRLAGRLAGAVAAIVVATSEMLAVYGSFGRMYALFAFAGALAADLFVRALARPTAGTAAVAAAAALLLPAVHPYGVLMLTAEAIVALAVWRGRPLRPALPTLAIGLGVIPFAFADRRLAERFGVGTGGESLRGPPGAVRYIGHALAEFAGGAGPLLLLCLGLAAVGFVWLVRGRRAIAAYAALSLALPPVLLVAISTRNEDGLANLSTRHVIYALPLWAALIGVGAAAVLARAPGGAGVKVAGVALLAAALVAAPASGIRDPRTSAPLGREAGTSAAVAQPAAWLRDAIRPGDVLLYPSPVFLAALTSARHATLLDPSPGGVLGRGLRRLELPVPATFVAVPLKGARVSPGDASSSLDVRSWRAWLVVRAAGPLRTRVEVLLALDASLAAARSRLRGAPPEVRAYLRSNAAAVCAAIRRARRERAACT